MPADAPVAQRPVNIGFFSLPARTGVARIKARIGQGFAACLETRQREKLVVFDSFDWRLFGNDCLLVRQAETLRLIDLNTDAVVADLVWPKPAAPRFWWDLPASALREKLQQMLDVRALMPRLKLGRTLITIKAFNADQKTVARIAIERIGGLGPGPRPRGLRTCTLAGVRGYDDEYATAVSALKAAGLVPAPAHGLAMVLRQAGLNPGGYGTKPSLPLTPSMPTDRAGRRILAFLVHVMALNEEGIRKDIDTEFLHDFRVAVRRARSLLALVKTVIDPAAISALQTDLKALGQATNALRDLDVYGLNRQAYKAMLPPGLQPAIDPLFVALKRRRQKEKIKIAALIDTAQYQQLKARLRDDNHGLSATVTALPVGDFACQAIRRRFKKVIKAGRSMIGGATDEALHGLRIQCKKLRYALEFFAALADADQAAALIRQLKELQDYLGRVNDLAVQQRFLFAYLGTIASRTGAGLDLAAAVGALIGGLHQEQQRLRLGFADVFGRFDTKDNRRRCRVLFGPVELVP